MVGRVFLSSVLVSVTLDALERLVAALPGADTEWLPLLSACCLILSSAIWIDRLSTQRLRRAYRSAGA